MIEEITTQRITCDHCGQDLTESYPVNISECSGSNNIWAGGFIIFVFEGHESFCDRDCLIDYMKEHIK